jgi:hypothetical protein
MASALRTSDPHIQAEAARLRARYLERAAPHLVQEFGAQGGDMRALRRAGLQRLAELRQSRFARAGAGTPHPAPTPPAPAHPASLQRRIDQLYSEYAAASTQLQQLQASPTLRPAGDHDAADYIEVEGAGGWSTLLYSNVEGSIVEVAIDEVSALLETGDITEQTWVMVEGMLDWATFREFVAMYHLEDELLGSTRSPSAPSAPSPATRANFRDEMVSEALDSRPPLLSSSSLQSVSRLQEVSERRRSLLRSASETTITMLSPRSRTGSLRDSPRASPLSALSPARVQPPEPHTVMRADGNGRRRSLSPIPGS